MTSEQLHELCKDHIGKPWWPSKITAGKRRERMGYYWMLNGTVCSQVPLLADAILGAAVRWLVEHETVVRIGTLPYGGGWEVHVDGMDHSAGQPLAAVLAACAAVEGGQ